MLIYRRTKKLNKSIKGCEDTGYMLTGVFFSYRDKHGQALKKVDTPQPPHEDSFLVFFLPFKNGLNRAIEPILLTAVLLYFPIILSYYTLFR